MSEQAKAPSGSGSWAALTRRATDDPDFRERLIDDPRSTIEEATGQQVPDGVEIVIVENGPKTFHIVLPSADIDVEALEVSGGYYWDPLCACESPSY